MSMFGYLASKYSELQGDEAPVIAGVGLVRLFFCFFFIARKPRVE